MATIALYADKMNQMPGLFQEVKKSVTDYKSELSLLKKKSMQINQRVCDLSGTISWVQTSTQTQDEKIASLEILKKNSEQYMEDAVRVDNDVADAIRRSKNEFYDQYNYLKPEFEKTEWDKFCQTLDGAGEWCRKHWKEIVIGLVCIVVGAVLTALTGGVFAAAFLAGLKAAVISAVISGVISMSISLVSSGINGDCMGTMIAKMLNGFGDGFASGFLFGGIMAGASMVISSGFKATAKLGVLTGRKGGIGKDGIFKVLSPDQIARDGNGGGTLFKIGKIFRIDFDTRILMDIGSINPFKLANFMHMHMPGVTGNIPGLLIVKGHIPIGLYLSVFFGSIFKKESR